MNKEKIKGFITGIVVMTLIFSTAITGFAASGSQSITATYNNIKLYVNQKLITPKDAAGNTVEPFIYNGTTYLPVRAVANALGQDVSWDNSTKSVYIGSQPTATSYSRSNPAPVGTAQTITIDNYLGKYTVTIKVTEAFRGQSAWTAIKKANMFNTAPEDNNEYVLLSVEATIDSAENDRAVSLNDYDFKIYNSTNSEYERVLVVSPNPQFDGSAYEGGKIEGFMAFTVSTSDPSPKIVFGQDYDGTGGIWFSAVK